MREPKIAIVYDWMDKMGGVERMLLVLHDMFPHADWYTSFLDEQVSIVNQLRVKSYEFGRKEIKTSFMQRLPSFVKKNRILSLPFFPFAFESFDFSEYDLVISVTSSFAKGIITKPGTNHLCILLTPTRWLWGQEKNYKFSIFNFQFSIPFQSAFQKYLKRWDLVAATRPDTFVSISQTVAERCLKYYRRKSEVVYPPFEYGYWRKQRIKGSKDQGIKGTRDQKNKYFLVVSRLEPYKKIEIIIEAFNKLPDRKLVIIGAGSLEKKLQALAHANCQFITDISDEELARYYSHAEALIMPQEEDFGYVALEAQACGCPVIAYHKGGALETVVDGVTGAFFHAQTPDAVRKAVADFSPDTYNLKETTFLTQFSVESFTMRLTRAIQGLE
ncbi:glycosyltransferase [Candidatus Woesebacteria bacterium]|nr:glycosyltransferase [Candidatus Woesebacteria bacterium]